MNRSPPIENVRWWEKSSENIHEDGGSGRVFTLLFYARTGKTWEGTAREPCDSDFLGALIVASPLSFLLDTEREQEAPFWLSKRVARSCFACRS